MTMPTEAVKEPADRSCRVPERRPNDLRISVSHGTLHDFPNDVGNGRGFVENDEDSLALVVQAGECFGV